MLRALIVTLALLAALPLRAETPLIEVEFPETRTIPGQPLTLRITILTPTWLVKPAQFPSLEAPDLLVRLPARATTPVTRTIARATWSGVSRRYLLTPLAARGFALPARQVDILYADPDGGDPLTAALTIPPVEFAGVAPPGAEGLDPFIAADALTLEQTLSGPTEGLTPGDAVTRTVTATITGGSAMFLPPLLAPRAIEGLAAYPAAPEVSDVEARGTITGTRREAVTYAAQSGGAGDAPGVTLRWFNLKTGAIETAALDALPLSVDAPVAAAPVDARLRAVRIAAGLAGLLALWRIIGRARPRIAAWRAARRARWLASERRAFDDLMAAAARRDLGAAARALDLWAARLTGPDPRRDADLQSALIALGAARYGCTPGDDGAAWSALIGAARRLRRGAKTGCKTDDALPPLNPAPLGRRTFS